MRPIECVMDSNSKANRGRPSPSTPSPVPGGLEPDPHALELGSATGFTKGTIIPQKPPPTTIWSVGGTLRTPSATLQALLPLRRTGQLLDGRLHGSYPETGF